MNNIKGSILILGLLIMAVLLLIGGVFLSLTTTNFFLLTVDNEKVNAFWIAQAGVSQATHDLRRSYFNNEQRIFQKKFGNGLYRVGVITLRERGVHEILIISLGVSNYNESTFGNWKSIPSSYQSYSIISEARIASPTDYLIFGNENMIIGASPDLHQEQSFFYGGPVHSNGKVFLTGNGYRQYQPFKGCDIIKPETIRGPAVSSANIIFREDSGYDPNNVTYYWKWMSLLDTGMLGEGDINIGEGTVSFSGWTPNIAYDKKYNLLNYSEFALAYKNGLPHDQVHDRSNSTELSDPEYAGGITPDNTLDGLLMDKNHGGFYISTPSKESLSKYYKPLVDKKWVLTKENTNNLPKRVFANEIIRKKYVLGNYAVGTNYDNYGKLDPVILGTGNGIKRDFSYYKINSMIGQNQYDIRSTSLKSVLIDNTEYPVNQGAWEWGNVTTSGSLGLCAFEEMPGSSDVIYLGIQGAYRLGNANPAVSYRTNWYIFPLAVDAMVEPAWLTKQARRITKVFIHSFYEEANGSSTLADATTTTNFGGPYTIRFYRWDSTSSSEKILYNDAVFPLVGTVPNQTKLGDLKTIYADMIEIKNTTTELGVPLKVIRDGKEWQVKVSLQFDNGETSADTQPIDLGKTMMSTENDCKNEVIIPVGKGGLNGLSRALNNGPGQNVEIPFAIGGSPNTKGKDDENGYYIFWSPYGGWNPAPGTLSEAGNQTSVDRNINSIFWGYWNINTILTSVYVQKNGTGVLIPCPYLIVRDAGGRNILRFSTPPPNNAKVKIYPMMRIYSLDSNNSPINLTTTVLPGRYYTVNPFTGSINTTSNNYGSSFVMGTDSKIEAYELDLGLIGTEYPDFPIDPQYADGWYDYNYNGVRDTEEDIHGIIYSEVPLIVKGSPKKPVTIVCTEDIYVKSINDNYADDDLSAKPVGLISSKAIWIAKWDGDVPGSAVTNDVILNRVSLYSQGSGIYFYGGVGVVGKFKIIGSIYFGGVYFGNYYITEHPEALKDATYSYGQYTIDPLYPAGYDLDRDNSRVLYVYASSFRGSIDTKDYRRIPPPNMPVDFKIIRIKEGVIDNTQTFLSQLVEHEKSQKIVPKEVYFDFITGF